MNWWLVSNHLKHGMMTVPAPVVGAARKKSGMVMPKPSREKIAIAAAISFAVLFAGVFIGYAGR